MKPSVLPNKFINPPDTIMSLFDVRNISAHSNKSDVPTAAIQDLDDYLVIVCRKHNLDSEQAMQLLVSTLELNIVQVLPPNHVSPKMFMVGLTFLKAAHTFASKTALYHCIFNTINNLKVFDSHLRKFCKEFTVEYDEVPIMEQKIVDKLIN